MNFADRVNAIAYLVDSPYRFRMGNSANLRDLGISELSDCGHADEFHDADGICFHMLCMCTGCDRDSGHVAGQLEDARASGIIQTGHVQDRALRAAGQ